MVLAAAGPNPMLTECSDNVCNNILNARALSTRAQYDNRWQLFTAWCSDRAEDPLSLPPFEPLAQAELKWVSTKTSFLLAITSAKRFGELQALSVSDSCLRWNSDRVYPVAESSSSPEGTVIVKPQPTCPPGTMYLPGGKNCCVLCGL